MSEEKVPDELEVLNVLKKIPYAGKENIVSAGIIKAITPNDDYLEITLAVPGDRAMQLGMEAKVKTSLSQNSVPLDKVRIKFAAGLEGAPNPMEPEGPTRILGIRHIIAIGSGKGGVGKSTATMNIAASMVKAGYKVGVLDADIYGPSIGKMSGLVGKADVETKNERIIPILKHGMKLMSISFLIDEATAVVWRGPMLGKAIEQFLFDIEWGELDYLLIDLPPGTGDVQLSLAQMIQLDGALIITTPQNVALQDASRAVDMFNKVNIPILGVIENMSEFICPNCGHASHIFSKEGGKEIAKKIDVPLLGEIPISVKVMEAGENGFPVTLVDQNGPDISDDTKKVIEAYQAVVKNIATRVEKK